MIPVEFDQLHREFWCEGLPADALLSTLQQAIAADTGVLIDCSLDYPENIELTEKPGQLVSPILIG